MLKKNLHYKSLVPNEQYDLVFTQGDFINYYLKGEIRYVLYGLFKFFVEVEYNVSKNKISNLIPFEEGKLLDRYCILTEL